MSELQPSDPRRLGSYEIAARLGEGGQGVVYLGISPAGTKVAVKLLRPDLTEDTTARNRFVREVRAAEKVARFCTAQVLEADVAGDRPYIVSEYVEGPSLYRQVKEEGPRDGAALERLAISTATALVAIHQAGILHRDFKPHNVLLGPDGPRVIDFGIAKALDVTSTVSTQAIGTPAYMAPEQVMGEALSNAVDIFSWAAVIVFAATGKPPFGADTIPAVINRILSQEPDLSGVPAELRGLVGDCLAKEPERRPTAQAVLMRLLGHENVVPAYGPGPQASGPGAAAAAGLAGMTQAAADGDTPPTRIEPAVSGTSPTAVLPAAGTRVGATDPFGPGGTGPGAGGPTLPPVQGYPPDRSGNRGVLIAAIAAAVVLLGILGITMLLLTSHGSPSGHATTSTSGPSPTATSGTSTTSGSSPTATRPQHTDTQTQTSAPPHHSTTPTHTATSAPPTTSEPTTSTPGTTEPASTAPASGKVGATKTSG